MGTEGRCSDEADVTRSRDEAQKLGGVSLWRADRKGKQIGFVALKAAYEAWYWFVKQEVESHSSFSQSRIPGGKGTLKISLLGAAQSRGQKSSDAVAAIQAPGDDILNWQSWLEKWNGRGRSKKYFCRENNKK